MSFVDDLRRLAGGLTPSETPGAHEHHSILGAVIRVLEHEGVKVAEELFPEEPVAPAVEPGVTQALDYDQLAAALLRQQQQQQRETVPVDPSSPSEPDVPAQTPVTAGSVDAPAEPAHLAPETEPSADETSSPA